MCFENPQNTHTHTFILTHFVQIAVGGDTAQPTPHNGNGPMSGIDAHEAASACHRLIGWSATFGDSSEACLSCQKTMKDKPKTQSQKVTNQKPKPTSATSQCQIKKLFRRGSKRGTLHSGWNLHVTTCTLLWQACCHHAVPSLKTLATCPNSLAHLSSKWTCIRSRLGCGRFFFIFCLNYHPIGIHGICKSRGDFVCYY